MYRKTKEEEEEEEEVESILTQGAISKQNTAGVCVVV